MADSKISALPAASTPLAGIEVLPIVQSGATVKATVANITGAGAYAGAFTSLAYTTTLTGGTGIVNLGSGQFYKDVSGNVGIGTSTPSAKFEIKTATGYGSIQFRPGGSVGSLIGFLDNAGLQQAYIVNNGGADEFLQIFSNNVSGVLVFGTNSAERMRIDSTGKVGIGTTAPNASAILDVQSTTKGVRMPNMTTAQKNAITSPAAGLMVFDTTLSKLCVYSGIAWETVTSI